MEKKELGREDVIEALKEIAFGRVNRGVELTYLSEPTAQLIRKMDLSAVAEVTPVYTHTSSSLAM